MPFSYSRTIHLSDTDAAGVVYFARTLSLCHEAYEEALADAGVDLKALLDQSELVVPISRCEADYLRPLFVTDKVRITVTPEQKSAESFAVRYEVVRIGRPDKLAVRARTEHVCTSPRKRERAPLPPAVQAWVARG